MNKILIAVAAAFALTSLCTAAVAGPQETRTESVQIKAREGFHMNPQDFQEYAYSYALSNDSTIHFSQKVRHYFAGVDQGSKVEIFPVSDGVFMTSAGTRIEFRDDGYAVTISNYERLPLAQKLPANTTVMAQR